MSRQLKGGRRRRGQMPERLRAVHDLARHLRSTMRGSPAKLPAALCDLLPELLAFYLQHRLAGAPHIHPGNTRMQGWAHCGPTRARALYASLRRAGVVIPVSHERGGAGCATRFRLSLPAIGRFLVASGANPHHALLDKLANLDPDRAPPRDNPTLASAPNPTLYPTLCVAGSSLNSDGIASGAVAGLGVDGIRSPPADPLLGDVAGATTEAAPPAPAPSPEPR